MFDHRELICWMYFLHWAEAAFPPIFMPWPSTARMTAGRNKSHALISVTSIKAIAFWEASCSRIREWWLTERIIINTWQALDQTNARESPPRAPSRMVEIMFLGGILVGYELHTPQINSAAHPNLYYPLKDSRANCGNYPPKRDRGRAGPWINYFGRLWDPKHPQNATILESTLVGNCRTKHGLDWLGHTNLSMKAIITNKFYFGAARVSSSHMRAHGSLKSMWIIGHKHGPCTKYPKISWRPGTTPR